MNTYWLIGAGGTGSILYQPLVRMLDTHHGGPEGWILAIMDGDNLEARNLERQLFPGHAVGENKAVALANTLPHPAVRAIPAYLDDEQAEKRIQDGDAVLIAADNYQVRARIEDRAMALDNVLVINGGNERHDGSVQIFERIHGLNHTPPLSWEHDEIRSSTAPDPSELSCLEKAQMPGGEQTIAANMMSATLMLNALRHALTEIPWLESTIFFDLNTVRVRGAQPASGYVQYDPRVPGGLVPA